MRITTLTTGVMVVCGMLLGVAGVGAQDWPQWRGPNRDAKATGFKAPATWPKELTQKWKVKVGNGVATPALVGDKLYVFSREEPNEVVRCLDAASGKELWQDKYEAGAATGPSSQFPGPRSSPTVADGKVVTLGTRGILTCYDAANGKVMWRKDDYKGFWPEFFTSSSPMIVGGLCIAQVGGKENGQRNGKVNAAIVGYDLASGEQKWKWDGDSTAYASPELLTLDGVKAIVAETAGNLVAVGAADGKLLWKTAFAPKGTMTYNACTPILDGQTIVISGSGQGTKAMKLEKKGDEFAAKDLWSIADPGVKFNTPVIKDGLVYGITDGDKLFCLNAETGKTAWTTALGGGGGRNSGYGSIVDAGPVLMALNPGSQLVVFEPGDKEFKQLAKYKVADSPTYAYPIIVGNRVYVKDSDSIILWTIE
ncbi:MAG TPA: PQQ-binding-like beta-propeller repeat protein [Gemmataceae bacterium]|nr:PQQ-binding-like beta-propeller repeat protein [Gemmataceae bacterium]